MPVDILDSPEKHYPLAMHDYLVQALKNCPPEQYQDRVRRLDRMMRLPSSLYRPLPAAKRFHQSERRFRWAIGGNRSSKSHSVAQEVFWYATGTHPWKAVKVPNTIWYCTITWEMVGTILWEKIERLLCGYDQHGDLNSTENAVVPHSVVWHNKGLKRPNTVFIEVPGGESRIIFKAYEQGRDAFQGTERRLIANDEQFSEDIYLEQITRIGAGEPLDFIAAMTPIIPQSWLEKLLDNPPPTHEVFEYPLDDNRISQGGFIPDQEIDELIDSWPEEVQPTRRMGKWASFLGAVFKSWSRTIHIVKEADEIKFFPRGGKPDISMRTIGGIDFGGNNPFVMLWATRIPHMDNAWYVYDEYYWDYKKRGLRLLRDHAKEILKRTAMWKAVMTRVWADHDCQDRVELAHGGVPTMPASKSVLASIETVQTLLKPRGEFKRPQLYVASRCVNTCQQMASYHWAEGTDTKDPADEPVKKDDHTVDVVRYIMHSERSGPTGSPVPEVVGVKRIF